MFPSANSALSIISILAVLQNFFPPEFRDILHNSIEALWNQLNRRFNLYISIDVPEDLYDGFRPNDFYREVQLYLGSLESCINKMDNVRVHRCFDSSGFSFSLPPGETVEDRFKGAQMLWTHQVTQKQVDPQQGWYNPRRGRKSTDEDKRFSLKLLKTDRARLLRAYFEHISKISKEMERRNSQRKLYTNDGDYWDDVDFEHPSTFDTLALLPELKEQIKSDLKIFSESENYYHGVGRTWKRGYLLYGPPGTGKTSMIAAMANFLEYDIYDLELTNVAENSQLKSLLIRTTRKSIIVIEDVDCSLDLSEERAAKWTDEAEIEAEAMGLKRSSKFTLSGLLNFTDGLWSCCGEERIFVFTTNHKERLDAALLRSGRMDVHILLSYCTFPAFKVLAANYLGLQEHELFKQLEEEMRNDCKLTPAEVVEVLISNKEEPEVALHKLMAALRVSPDQSSDLSFRPEKSPTKHAHQRHASKRFSRSLDCTHVLRKFLS